MLILRCALLLVVLYVISFMDALGNRNVDSLSKVYPQVSAYFSYYKVTDEDGRLVESFDYYILNPFDIGMYIFEVPSKEILNNFEFEIEQINPNGKTYRYDGDQEEIYGLRTTKERVLVLKDVEKGTRIKGKRPVPQHFSFFMRITERSLPMVIAWPVDTIMFTYNASSASILSPPLKFFIPNDLKKFVTTNREDPSLCDDCFVYKEVNHFWRKNEYWVAPYFLANHQIYIRPEIPLLDKINVRDRASLSHVGRAANLKDKIEFLIWKRELRHSLIDGDNSDIEELAEKITFGKTTAMDKVKSIIRAYSLLGQASVRDINQAAEKGFGNYFENQDICIGVLRAAGIPAIPIRVYKQQNDTYDSLFFDSDNYIDGIELIIDNTTHFYFINNNYALDQLPKLIPGANYERIVDPEGADKDLYENLSMPAGFFGKIPNENRFEYSRTDSVFIVLMDDLQSLKVREKRTYRNQSALHQMTKFLSMDRVEIDSYLQDDHSGYRRYALDVKGKIQSFDERDNSLTIEWDYVIPNALADVGDGRYVLNIPSFFTLPRVPRSLLIGRRDNYITHTHTQTHTIVFTVDYPSSMQIVETPKDGSVESMFGVSKVETSKQSNKCVVRADLLLRQVCVEPTKIGELRRLVGQESPIYFGPIVFR